MKNADDVREERIAGLRAYVTLLHANPDLPAPRGICMNLYRWDHDEAARGAALNAFAQSLPHAVKDITDGHIHLSAHLHGLEVTVNMDLVGVGTPTPVIKHVDGWSFPNLPAVAALRDLS